MPSNRRPEEGPAPDVWVETPWGKVKLEDLVEEVGPTHSILCCNTGGVTRRIFFIYQIDRSVRRSTTRESERGITTTRFSKEYYDFLETFADALMARVRKGLAASSHERAVHRDEFRARALHDESLAPAFGDFRRAKRRRMFPKVSAELPLLQQSLKKNS